MSKKMSKKYDKNSLNYLDDSALLKLFERLPLDDLCTMKGICIRFRLLATKTFKRHHAKNMVFENLFENMITRIIKCFGKLMTSITIDGSVAYILNMSMLELIAGNCGSKLTKLRLKCFNFDKQTIAVLKTMVSKLTTIELLYCLVQSKQLGVNYNVAFKAVENLKEFVVIGGTVELDLKFLNKKWPALEKVELISVDVTDELMFAQLLKKNPELKHFSYLPNNVNAAKSEWMKSFHNSGLEELSIELVGNIKYPQLFDSMQNLRCIVISCKDYPKTIHPILNAMSTIETLEVFSLWNVGLGEILLMPELQHVHTLELRNVKQLFHRNVLVLELRKERWGKLTNLYLDHSVVGCAEDVGLFVQNLQQVENLYLNDMKTFDLMKSSTLP